MPLSDHEQRMLDQIESELSTDDPKLASSVRGGSLRAPSARRRLQGAALFVIGVAMLVSGVAFKATMIGNFPILSVFGFAGMFGGWCSQLPARAWEVGATSWTPCQARRASVRRNTPAAHLEGAWKIASAAASISRQQFLSSARTPSPKLGPSRCHIDQKIGVSMAARSIS
jgi:hypothetical protein